MKIKNVLLIANLLVALAAVVYYALYKTEKKSDQAEFVVGTAAHYAPWVSVNERGDYEGFDIDVAHAVAEKMNKKLVLKDLGSMTALFIALEQGSIDAIIWGISITKERLERIAMIRYSGDTVTTYPLLFWNGLSEKIKTVHDMKGMTVSVESGSAQDAALNSYEFLNKKPIEKVDDGLLDIQYGKSDAVIVEQPIAKKFIAKYPQIGVLEMPLSEDNKVFGVGVCVKKENTVLNDAIQKAVEALQKEGTIESYEKKWGMV